jgi:hypothetical protein
MGFIFVIPLIGIYVILAILFVSLIWKHFRKPRYLWLAVAFVILLPTWDVVLGYIVYYSVCPFTKAVIYETAETDGIYYEGWPRNKLLLVDRTYFGETNKIRLMAHAKDDFRRGYNYVESMIESEGDPYKQTPLSSPQAYKCTSQPSDPKYPHAEYQQCIPVVEIKSGFAVKTKYYSFFNNELSSMKIYNRTTGKLMAEYMDVSILYHFPFFDWLLVDSGLYGHGRGMGRICPYPTRFHDFQYDVLKNKT